jgi:hypothetical protein
MKATELPNRVLVFGKDMPYKKAVSVSYTDSNIALFEKFIADNEAEYTLTNYPCYHNAARQFLFDIAAFFNPSDSGQLFDIRTKFYKKLVRPYQWSIICKE